MFKNFGKNFKKYFDYLMTVDYKELFINTVILLCIMALSGFVFVPIALIRDWVSNMVTMVTPFSENGVKIFNFVFLSISTICTFLGFVFSPCGVTFSCVSTTSLLVVLALLKTFLS